MTPPAANGHASTKPPASKPTGDTPDHKTSEDPRTNSVHQALAQHPYGGAANLRDIYTNQGEYAPERFCSQRFDGARHSHDVGSGDFVRPFLSMRCGTMSPGILGEPLSAPLLIASRYEVLRTSRVTWDAFASG